MSQSDVSDTLERARVSVKAGAWETAEGLLKHYVSEAPDDREGQLLLGITLSKTGKLDEAVRTFNRILAHNPQHGEALYDVAILYYRQGKLQDALVTFTEVLDVDPNRVVCYYTIGNIQRKLGNLKAAIMAYAKVIELEPDYVSAYNNLGIVYADSHDYTKAAHVLHQGLAVAPQDPILHFNYGVVLEADGRLEEAANEYHEALYYRPHWSEPLHNLGVLLFKRGRYSEAQVTFAGILEEAPHDIHAWNNLGVISEDRGYVQEAIQHYRRALELDSAYEKAAVNLNRALKHIDSRPRGQHVEEVLDAGMTSTIWAEVGVTDVLRLFDAIKMIPIIKGEAEISFVEAAVPPASLEGDLWGIKKNTLAGLFKYLKGLTNYLPSEERELFMQSEVRSNLEKMINTLEGSRRGLFREIQARFSPEN